jgi:glycosyltransferase involved in cell wall biosynthesis
MLARSRILAVVPAFDEGPRIADTLRTVPDFVERVIVVDDGSTDDTAARAAGVGDARVEVLRLPCNRGVGAAICAGYRRALALGADVVVVIAGDGQMHPADMWPVVREVASGRADYAKGNRLLRLESWRRMPPTRLLGTVVLSAATMLATGFVHSFDSQCGYTAISAAMLRRLPLDDLFPRYGYPNDLLIQLSRVGARVRDVPVRAVYGPGTSKMRIAAVVGPICHILARGMRHRLRAALPSAPWRASTR